MIGKILGQILSAPIKIVNAPFAIADAGLRKISQDPDAPKLTSAPLSALSEVIEDGCERLDDDDD